MLARRGVAAVCAVLGVSMMLASVASADPIADKKAQAAQLAAQIDQLTTKQEQLAERYNAAQLKASQLKDQAALAAANLDKARQQMNQRRSAVQQVALDAYTSHGSSGPKAQVADGNTFAVSEVYATTVVGGQREAIDALRQAQLDLADQQTQLNAAQAKAQVALKQVAQDRSAAAAASSQAEAALGKVKGELAQLVAEEQARKAAADAQRARDALARQTAAAAASRSRVSQVSSPSGPPPPVGHGASAAIAEAQRQIGKPYRWGAAGPDSFDCSGLTMWAWRAGGVSLPHYTKAQYDATTHVSLSDLQPGDLVFFGSDFHHMGLYVGGGQMIEAPHTGANVRYASIYRSDLIAASRPG